MPRGLHLTPDLLESTYRLLQLTAPFNRWRLPDADDVYFRIEAKHDCHGWFTEHRRWNHMRIGISTVHVKTLCQLTETMAHEMVHMREYMTCQRKVWPGDHGPRFKTLAAQVCRIHGFDPATF